MKKIILLTSAVVFLSACGQDTYTAEYLYENDDIRKQVLSDCAVNKQSVTNCKNAQAAQNKKFNSTGGKNVQQWQ